MAQVLVVDDDPDISDGLKEILAEAGHSVRQAGNGPEAVEKATAYRPDLVLLDVDLPIFSGPEVACRLFLRDAGLDLIPIILVSAAIDLRSIARSVGTPYLLRKPFSIEELMAVVDRALGERIAPVPDQAP